MRHCIFLRISKSADKTFTSTDYQVFEEMSNVSIGVFCLTHQKCVFYIKYTYYFKPQSTFVFCTTTRRLITAFYDVCDFFSNLAATDRCREILRQRNLITYKFFIAINGYLKFHVNEIVGRQIEATLGILCVFNIQSLSL